MITSNQVSTLLRPSSILPSAPTPPATWWPNRIRFLLAVVAVVSAALVIVRPE